MGLFNSKKSKKKQENEVKEPEKMSLYLLMDAPKIGVVQYMKENNIEVKGIFYNIMDANYEFMQEDANARIVIIETGAGLFSKVDNREEVISLLGMCQTETKRATVFYTDTAFKATIQKAMPKTPLIKYVSTFGIVETLQGYNEVYVEGGAQDTVIESLLQFQGELLEYPEVRQSNFRVDVTEGVIGTAEDTVQTFKVKY